jgi:hypothetical protein
VFHEVGEKVSQSGSVFAKGSTKGGRVWAGQSGCPVSAPLKQHDSLACLDLLYFVCYWVHASVQVAK